MTRSLKDLLDEASQEAPLPTKRCWFKTIGLPLEDLQALEEALDNSRNGTGLTARKLASIIPGGPGEGAVRNCASRGCMECRRGAPRIDA